MWSATIQPRERETWGGLGRGCGILEMSLRKLRGNGLEESEGLVKALGQVLWYNSGRYSGKQPWGLLWASSSCPENANLNQWLLLLPERQVLTVPTPVLLISKIRRRIGVFLFTVPLSGGSFFSRALSSVWKYSFIGELLTNIWGSLPVWPAPLRNVSGYLLAVTNTNKGHAI